MFLSILTGLIFGLAPAVQASKTGLSEILKESGRSAESGPGASRLRSALVIVEVALAVVLLVGAGLMIRSFLRLLDTAPGFNPAHVLTMRIALPRLKYREPDQVRAFYQQLLQKLESLPGVQSVGASTSIMLGRLPASSGLSVEGRPAPSSASRVDIPVTYDSVTPKFFPTMGISLVRGRLFSDHDDARSPRVAIINEALVRRFFPTEDPLGKRVTFDNPQRPDSTWFSIVGVVGDVRRSGLDAEPRAELYIPHNQSPDRSLTIVLRTTSDAAALARVARSELWTIDKDQPVSSVKTMDQIMDESLSQRRFNVLLLGLFAAVAIILASVGIYGVVAYSVTRRTHEIGIRMALGAKQGDVLRLVVRQGMILAAAGLLLGLALAWSLTRVMRGLVYGVSTTDPVTFVMISLLFGGVALAASYLPARRASKVDPMVALRSE
jgi:putative ABC transport system permease protein